MSEEKRALILKAAIDVFGRYGFKRCSMEDIAEAAGVSRPALYQYFRNKTEIFRAGSEAAQSTAIDAAEAAATLGLSPADRLAAMLIAYKGPSWRIISATPHGEELLGLNAALAEDITEAALARSAQVFTDALAAFAAPGWDLANSARLLIAAAWSSAHQAKSETAFEADMRALARIWAAAVSLPRDDQ